MHSISQEVAAQADALHLDWSRLDQLEVDASVVLGRSAVFQRTFSEGDTPVPVYVKIYTYRKHPLQRLGRPGRSRIEARNLLFFQRIGIPAPRVLGWSERRNRIGRIVEEYIITEAISGAEPLDVFVPAACPDRSEPLFRERRDTILLQLGRWTRAMHDCHFFHKDLKWRNLLGRLMDDTVELYWIDCPTGDFHPSPLTRRHHQLKDCATLDKLARILCTTEERRRFVAGYLDLPEDAPEVANFSQAVSRYRRRRFDAKDDRQRAHAAD